MTYTHGGGFRMTYRPTHRFDVVIKKTKKTKLKNKKTLIVENWQLDFLLG